MKRKTFFLIGGVVLATEIIWQLCKKFHGSRKYHTRNAIVPKQNIAEVMFFSKESGHCRDHADGQYTCHKVDCPVRYLRRLESYIKKAERRLDVCMYVLTCHGLSLAFVEAHKRGVHVRIIMDHHMASNDAARTGLFHNNGIEVRMQNPEVLMHHKFVIVDEDILITGSTNWTMSAFFGNFENILVTNQSPLVEPFLKEFERMWQAFRFPVEFKSEDNVDDTEE
ncbi:mitochondrial cardiolipin hydrolase zuc isoform X2 [Nomia melanderi]|nr:mitochondrial cardiolipin hydrolase isoform X2 [Nomia melanderi]XP_031832620.1 mitochondrial cardiolipin hydrolase isoform X2 [Nomia melanderi]